MEHREIQRAAVLSSHRASRHVAAPSLGHYASLSSVVIGRGRGKILDCRFQIVDRQNQLNRHWAEDMIGL